MAYQSASVRGGTVWAGTGAADETAPFGFY